MHDRLQCSFCRQTSLYKVIIRKRKGRRVELPFCSRICEMEYIHTLYRVLKKEYEEQLWEIVKREREKLSP